MTTKKQLTWQERMDKEYPVLMAPGAEPLTEKVADYIGCVDDEQCDCYHDWRRCIDCIEQARGVVKIVQEGV